MADKDPLADFSGEPLTARENQKLRKIVRDQERMDWVWATFRIWLGWAAATMAAVFAAKDYLVKVFKALFS